MLSHSLTKFQIQKYYHHEPKFIQEVIYLKERMRHM